MSTTPLEDGIQKMYIAYYGRPADPNGRAYWSQILETGSSEDATAIVNAFGTSPEFSDRFGGQPNETLVNNIFEFLFGRDADPEGMAFYLNQLQTSESTLPNIALVILNGARDTEGGSQDATIINNKMTTANYFTSLVEVTGAQYGSDQIDAAKAVLDTVNASFASLEGGIVNASATVDSFPASTDFNAVVGTDGDDTLAATLGRDVISGLDGSDKFVFGSSQSIEALMDTIADYEADANGDQVIFSNVPGVVAPNTTTPVDVQSAVSEGVGNEDVKATVTDGLLTVSGADANAIDTLSEWFNVAKNTQAIPLDQVGAFAFNGSTYVIQNEESQPIVVELNGLNDIAAVSASAGAINTLFIG